jgi:hypothetical protein
MCKDCNPLFRRRSRRALIALWKRWEGRCYWCDCETYIYPDNGHKDQATKDHLRDRYNVTRWDVGVAGEERIVLACFECNQERGFAIDRSKSKPSKKVIEKAKKQARKREQFRASKPFLQRTVPMAPLVLLHKVWIDAFEERSKSQGCK